MSRRHGHDLVRGRPRMRPERAQLAEDSQASNCFRAPAHRQSSVACDQAKAICSVPRGTQSACRALEVRCSLLVGHWPNTLRRGAVARGARGFVERGSAGVPRGTWASLCSGALPWSPEYRNARNPNELVKSRRHSIKRPELETASPAGPAAAATACRPGTPPRLPAGCSMTNCLRYATLSAVK